jgi:hypothetical protein
MCCITGQYVAIEAKAPGEDMTDRQERTAKEIRQGDWEVIRDVGTDRPSIMRLHKRLFGDNKYLPADLRVTWERYFANAQVKKPRTSRRRSRKDAHQHAT